MLFQLTRVTKFERIFKAIFAGFHQKRIQLKNLSFFPHSLISRTPLNSSEAAPQEDPICTKDSPIMFWKLLVKLKGKLFSVDGTTTEQTLKLPVKTFTTLETKK